MCGEGGEVAGGRGKDVPGPVLGVEGGDIRLLAVLETLRVVGCRESYGVRTVSGLRVSVGVTCPHPPQKFL